MGNLPTQAERVAEMFLKRAGKTVRRIPFSATIPENKSILVVALLVDEDSEDALLAAMILLASGTGTAEQVEAAVATMASMKLCEEAARMRTPGWTPEGQEWLLKVTTIGMHGMIPEA